MTTLDRHKYLTPDETARLLDLLDLLDHEAILWGALADFQFVMLVLPAVVFDFGVFEIRMLTGVNRLLP